MISIVARSYSYVAMSVATLLVRVILLIACGTSIGNAADEAPFSVPLQGLSAIEIASLYGEKQKYNISRNGKTIGTHMLSFEAEGTKLTVKIDSSLAVRVLTIPVYRLAYVAEEVWMDDALVSANATTTENGNSNTVALDTSSPSSSTGFATNHWHPGVLAADTVFNTLTGEIDSLEVIYVGRELLNTAAGELDARHFRYTKEVDVNVWYDNRGLWIKMQFEGEDGSDIKYMRQ